ncbi:MAG: hypothetical protein JWR18_304, partial [Segetibacter sp.]|nr:hypothetical protein [Segetibacter sp.]
MRLTLLSILVFIAFVANAQQTILHCGRLIDVKSKK